MKPVSLPGLGERPAPESPQGCPSGRLSWRSPLCGTLWEYTTPPSPSLEYTPSPTPCISARLASAQGPPREPYCSPRRTPGGQRLQQPRRPHPGQYPHLSPEYLSFIFKFQLQESPLQGSLSHFPALYSQSPLYIFPLAALIKILMKFNSADSLLVPRGAGIMLTLVAPASPVTALGLVRRLCLAHPLRHQVRPSGHH